MKWCALRGMAVFLFFFACTVSLLARSLALLACYSSAFDGLRFFCLLLLLLRMDGSMNGCGTA